MPPLAQKTIIQDILSITRWLKQASISGGVEYEHLFWLPKDDGSDMAQGYLTTINKRKRLRSRCLKTRKPCRDKQHPLIAHIKTRRVPEHLFQLRRVLIMKSAFP